MLLYLVRIAGVQWRFSFVFRSSGLSRRTSMHDPASRSFFQRILCLVKVTSFLSSEHPWKSFLSLGKTRCSISVPPVPKRSSTKRLLIPATDFRVAGLLAMGFCIFSNSTSCHCLEFRCLRFTHTTVCVQHVTASISSCGNNAITTQCLAEDVPPASGGIVHAVCWFLLSCSNVRR